MRRPGRRRTLPATRGAVAGLAIALALATVACLPAALRPTPAPTPTPTPTAPPPPTPSPTPPPPTPTPGPTFVLHAVVRGDSLNSLADTFHTDPRSIAYWNRDEHPSLDPESAGYLPDRLERGWVLRILPGGTYQPPPDDGETGESPTPTPPDELEPLPPESASPAA